MSTKLERIGNFVVFTDSVSGVVDEYPADDVYHRNEAGQEFTFYHKSNQKIIHTYQFSDLVDEDSVAWTSIAVLKTWLRENTGDVAHLTNGGIDVQLQDQHTPILIGKMSVVENQTTLSALSAIDDLTITVTDPTGFATGKYLSIFSVADNRFYLGMVLGVAASVVTIDAPLDFAFPIGSFVTSGFHNMGVNGAVTPVVFGLRNTDEAIGITVDITRLLFTCLADSAIDLSMFGNIAGGITNGVVLRTVDGLYRNIFNVKTNADMKNLMFDFDIVASTNPSQGQDGFTGRLTFAGQNKVGVTIRLAPGEDLQFIVQDDLSTLTHLEITVEGHEVE